MKPRQPQRHPARDGRAGPSQRLNQFAALPWRLNPEGAVEVLLITSRETRRWVVPKGWPMKGLKPHQAAAREAWEEAGVEGRIGSRRVGAFDYDKRLSGGALQPVRVEVYPLRVEVVHDAWPEASQRERSWVAPSEAAGRVDEPGLARILSTFTGAGK
ncbi:MAG: NUDIX hydrolase [Phenylobacterium sp.]